MIDNLHMILDLIIERRANYIVDFLRESNGIHIVNPDDFRIEWLLTSKGAVLLQITFSDVLFYEFMVDYRHNEKEMDKWTNRVNTALKKQNNVSKWQMKGARIIEENNQKKIRLSFCQW